MYEEKASTEVQASTEASTENGGYQRHLAADAPVRRAHRAQDAAAVLRQLLARRRAAAQQRHLPYRAPP